jgi:hypothetical protein
MIVRGNYSRQNVVINFAGVLAMLTLARSATAYVLSYLVLMLPTYVLPYFGSNSAVLGMFSSAIRGSLIPMPPWWMHVWCLVALIVLNWLRGHVVNKKYLAVFPFVAAFFDMTPGLSSIPLIPTVMHLIGLVLGAMGVSAIADDELADSKLQSSGTRAAIGVGLMTAAVLLGSIFSMTGLFKKSHVVVPAAVKSEPVKVVMPNAIQTPNAVSQPVSPASAAKPVAMHRPKPLTSQTVNQTQPPQPAAAPTKSEVRYIKIND